MTGSSAAKSRRFGEALRRFVQASPWLTEEHEPELTALRFLADQLDAPSCPSPAPLIAQWGLILRSLRKQAPAEEQAADPLEAALKSAGQ